ncbi:MAG: hypothetical protein AAF368_01135, partial [Planctomycetota bacterium]
ENNRFPLTLEVWHDGSPLGGAEVRMQTWVDGREVRGATDAEGFCHLSPSARGNSRIRVRLSPEGSFVDFDWFFTRDSEPEASRRALQVETRPKLRLDIPSGLLRCRVSDSEGIPAEGVEVRYEGGSGGTHLASQRLVVTDENGEAVLWGVPEADCSLSVASGTLGEPNLQKIGPLRPSASFESATVHELRLAPPGTGGKKGEAASKE